MKQTGSSDVSTINGGGAFAAADKIGLWPPKYIQLPKTHP